MKPWQLESGNVGAALMLAAVAAGCGGPSAHVGGATSVTAASIDFFEQRLQERPSSYATANALAARYQKRFSEVGRYEAIHRAEDIARQGLDAVPTASGHARLASVLLVQHRFREAEQHVRTALRLDSANAGANAAAFDVFSAHGAYAKALSALERLDQGGFAYLVRRAASHEGRGDFTSAERDLQRACRGVTASSTDATLQAWCFTRQADAAIARGGARAANRLLQRALHVAPEYPAALEARAWIAYRAGDLSEARALYHRVLAGGREDHYDVHLSLARIGRLQGDTARAARHEATFERLAGMHGMDALYGHHLATHLADRPDRAGDALKLAHAEVGRRPTPESYETLSWALFHLGRIEEAVDAARRAVSSAYSDGTLLYRAGVVYLAAGHSSEGRRLFALALRRRFELDPEDERDIRRRLEGGG